MKNRITRRNLLGMMAAAASAPLAAPNLAVANAMRQVKPVGVQLYTVRNLLSADTQGTLDAIAAIGYDEVETAGYADLTPTQFANALNSAGLRSPSAHVPLQSVVDNPQELIEAAATIGHNYLVVPWLTEEQRDSLDKYRRLADLLNQFGEQCASAGLQLAYHNHDFEFEPMDDMVPYDLLLERCDAELVKLELDLFWTVKANVDPISLFKAWPGRFPLCHVKDMNANGEMVAVGEGTIDFTTLFKAGETGGLKHYFVEHDNPVDAMKSITYSMATVKAIRF